MKNMRNTNKGFTLVELIVVVTILAILATIAFLTLGTYTGDTRDSKRVAQAKSLFNKVEILRAQKDGDYSQYITADSAVKKPTDATTTGVINFEKVGESETAFKLPQANEKYIVAIKKVAAVTTPGSEKDARECMAILTYDETGNGNAQGNANVNVTGNCIDGDLTYTGIAKADFGL